MIIVPFEAAHGAELAEGDLNIELNRPIGVQAEHYQQVADLGWSFSAMNNGWLIGSAGLVPLWPGVAEAWLLASDRINDHAISAGRIVRKRLFEIVDEEGLHRVQAMTRSDTPSLKRWAAWLGMKHEGKMLSYNQNRDDFERYAWVRKES